MQVTVKDVATKPIEGQKTGTSGLRKKTKVFMSDNYLGNWVRSLFNALGDEAKGKELGLGGDGRCVGDNAGRGPLQCVGVNMGRVGKCFQGRAVDCIARATFLKDFDGGRGVERGHGGLSLGQSECSFC
jgi:phosphoglucomutase